jgi:hypothetical protein
MILEATRASCSLLTGLKAQQIHVIVNTKVRMPPWDACCVASFFDGLWRQYIEDVCVVEAVQLKDLVLFPSQ